MNYFLEFGLIGLLSISQPNALNQTPPNIARPFLVAQVDQFMLNYEAEVIDGKTDRYKLAFDVQLTDHFAVGYENRKFHNSYGNNGEYVTFKISYGFGGTK